MNNNNKPLNNNTKRALTNDNNFYSFPTENNVTHNLPSPSEDPNKKPKISNQSPSNLNQIDIKERTVENILKKVTTFIGTIEKLTDLSPFGSLNTVHIGCLMAPLTLHKDTTLLKIDHFMPGSQILRADSLQEIEINILHSQTSIDLSHLLSLKIISIKTKELESLIILPENCKKIF